MSISTEIRTTWPGAHGGDWDNKCVERVEGEDVVLPYSDGSVKEAEIFGSGAWHVKA